MNAMASESWETKVERLSEIIARHLPLVASKTRESR